MSYAFSVRAGRTSALWLLAGIFSLAILPGLTQAQTSGTAPPQAATPAAAPAAAPKPAPKIPSTTCLMCHGMPGFGVPGPDGKMRSLAVDRDKFLNSIHGKRDCVDCHTNITQVPHKPVQVQVSCVNCHEKLWGEEQKEGFAAAQKAGKGEEYTTLAFVDTMIHKFMNSIHARPSTVDQSRTNATCYNCHDAHYVYPPKTPVWTQWRLNLPNTCGKCHPEELAAYATSVHGVEVLQNHNPKAAICADCHTSHDIENPTLSSTRLVITRNCGNCHQAQLQSYMGTYHGQVNRLGYAYTAKCFDCHGYHTIQRVNDPSSSVYPTNRLNTCRKCHTTATPGFATFQPHGNSEDFDQYPLLWLAKKFMTALLIVVFAFFWTHSALWFYRSYKERRARLEANGGVEPEHDGEETYVRRFGLPWRLMHLVVLLCTMTLVLTGMAVFYADSPWAPVVMRIFGGPRATAIVHRVCAATFITMFAIHLVLVAVRLVRNRSFQWVGPDSLVPRPQDLRDAVAMFAWFFGRGPRPVFDRWTYWEKFDYWAVFWGIAIIGGSGAILWFKRQVAEVAPGWVFNIATIFHGEEAVLAAVFLFTVHFFNNHFRPDKFPLDTVMFTGRMPLEEFRREHTEEYRRLVETGKLDGRLVGKPSPAFAKGARILGFTLITIGLTLLLLMVIGLISRLFGA